MDAYDSKALRVWRDQVTEEVNMQAMALAKGSATDYADYRDRAGRIKGLWDAVHIMDEVLDKLNGKTKEEI